MGRENRVMRPSLPAAVYPKALTALGLLAVVAGCAPARPAGTGIPLPGQAVPSARPEMALQIGHRDGIESMAFSPDGRTLVSGSRDRTVDVWDARTGELRRTLAGHGGPVHSVAVSPNGEEIVSGSEDRTIRVWDIHTGALRRTLRGAGGAVRAVAVSPDGATVAGGSVTVRSGHAEGNVVLWDSRQGIRRWSLTPEMPIAALAFSPDGRQLAAAGDRMQQMPGQRWPVKVWDTKTGHLMRTLPESDVVAVQYLRDGTLVTGHSGGSAAFWNAETGRRIRTLPLPLPVPAERLRSLSVHYLRYEFVQALTVSPDGSQIAVGIAGGEENAAALFDGRTGALRQTLRGARTGIAAVAFSPDGATLATGTADPQDFSHIGDVSLWDAGTGTLRQAMNGDGDWTTSAAFSRDGETLVAGRNDRTARVWSVKTGALRRTLTDPVRVFQVAVSPDGKTAATGNEGGTVRLWDVGTGRVKAVIAAHEESVDGLAFSPDGRTLASGGGHLWSGDVKTWDIGTGRLLRRMAGPSEGINGVAFSPDGLQIAAGSYDNTVKLWDARTGRLERTLDGYDGWVEAVAFSPDGRWIAGGKDGRPSGEWKIWDAHTGRLARGSGHLPTPVESLAFSPDGQQIAAGCLREDQPSEINGTRVVQVWDLAGKRRLTLPGPYTGAIPVAFAPSGRLLLTTGGDSGLVLRRPKTGEALLTLRILPSASGKPSPGWIASTPDGYYDASPGAANFIRWRVGEALYPASTYAARFHRPDLIWKAMRGGE